MHKSFPLWPIVQCRYSLSPHFPGKSEGWVKIYFVKDVKTDMTCAPPETYQNQKSFWIRSKQPPNTCRAGWANFFIKEHFFVKHPNEGIHMFSVVIIQPIYNAIQLSHWSSQRLSWLVQPWLVIRTYLKNYFTTLAFEMDDSNSRFRCTIVLPAHWLVSAFFMLLSWLYDTWCQTPF